jgi:hypothetical protein
MLYVRNVHLTRCQAYLSERVLHNNYYRKGPVENIFDRESRWAWRQDELIDGKPPVVK